jgi:HTH-type transcriptional regulator, pleiotropic regulator of extracellular virulence genes
MTPLLKPFQREEAADPEEVRRKIIEAKIDLAEAQGMVTRLRMLGEIGTLQRSLYDPAAVETFQQAIDLAKQCGDVRAEAVNTLRLAVAQQYLGQDAAATFDRAVALCKEHRTHEDFAMQHLGKYYMEQGRVGAALPLFEQALTIRQATGDPELIASTERALQGARALLASSAPVEVAVTTPALVLGTPQPPEISLAERISYRSYAVVQLGILLILLIVLALIGGLSTTDIIILGVYLVATTILQRVLRTRPTKEIGELDLLQQKLSNGAKFTLVELYGNYCVGCAAMNPLVDRLEAENNPRLQIMRLNIESVPGVFLKPDKSTFTPTFLLYDPDGNKIRETYLILDRARILYEVERLSRGSGPLAA